MIDKPLLNSLREQTLLLALVFSLQVKQELKRHLFPAGYFYITHFKNKLGKVEFHPTHTNIFSNQHFMM